MKRWGAYLLHFERPYKHARHYIGWSSDIDARVERHFEGHGSRLVQVVKAAGISIVLARVWWNKDRAFERRLKNQKHGPRLCPICREEKPMEAKPLITLVASLLLMFSMFSSCGPATRFDCEPAVACITANPVTRCDEHWQYVVVEGGPCDGECDTTCMAGLACMPEPGGFAYTWRTHTACN